MGTFRIEIPVRVREYDAHARRYKADSEVATLRFQIVAKGAREACDLVSRYMESRLTPPPVSGVPPAIGDDDVGAATGDDL